MFNTPKITCHLYDLMALDSGKPHIYTEPIYTKLEGIYGYLSVSGDKVFFFWHNTSSEDVCYDDVSEKFKVEYIIEQ